MINSKPWVWSKIDATANAYWQVPADEFLPIAARWKQKKYVDVLDLGCGTGRHSIFLAQNGFKVDAFDLSRDGIDALDEVSRLVLNIETKVGDMLNLPYREGSFDCVLAFHAIQHTDFSGLHKTLENISRVLRSGGEAFITLASKESGSWKEHASRRIDNYTLIKTEGPEIEVPHTYLNYSEVIEVLENFSIIKIQQVVQYLPKHNKKYAHFFILIKKA